ncbi:MAG: ShlB/FhaC/HecB family hemolysin secretion/activation protein [Elusimicrobia bacterium]|nr:ShlB/FhaC/HecB family hemolysin secretion/activation protein [Elusimicrobiota bacterium]
MTRPLFPDRRRLIEVVLAAALGACLGAAPVTSAAAAESSGGAGASTVIIDKLVGMILVADPKDVAGSGAPTAAGVQIKGIPLLERSRMKKKLGKYLGKPLTQAVRAQILSDIVLFYREHGRPVVSVTTPPQEITGGVLQVLVQEGKVGAIRVDGARWFDSKSIAHQIRISSGQAINANDLNEDLDWINRNPFRQVDLVYVKGSELGTTDLVLRETDRFPLRVYTGYEDSGDYLTGNNRVLAGVNWGNVFGLDGQLDYQYMADPQFLYFKAHTLTYTQPLPWRHTLTLIGSYATTRGDVPQPFNLGGFNWQASARYEIPLKKWGSYREGFDLGFDYKRADNNLAFGGQSVYGGTVDTVQWSLGYNADLKDALGATTMHATVVYSPGGLTPLDTNEAYNSARSGAAANYTYEKIDLSRTTGLPFDFTLVDLFTGQLSDANLIASEQLGFGGYDTIRGYDTRVVNADQGFIFSNEIRTPPISPLSLLNWKNLPTDSLQFIGFVDYGLAADKHLLLGEPATTQLLGVGPGLRYALASRLTVRADYGWRLLNVPSDRANAMRWHVGVVLSY